MITAVRDIGNTRAAQGASRDCVVIGGGVIGLCVARELAGAGLTVTLVERDRLGRGSSHAAAGMLAPQAEADEDDAFFRFARRSREMYTAFAAELLEETNTDIELDRTGTLCVAFTETEELKLARRHAWQSAANLQVERLAPDEARKIEPHLSNDLRAALLLPDDWQVENRRLTHALAASCATRGVELLTGTEVLNVERDAIGKRVEGVHTSRGRIATSTVVVAAGAWASRLGGFGANRKIEPVRGQMICLEASPPIVRHVVYGEHAYLVPRRDGRLLVGATVEQVGFDARVTAGGVGALAAQATKIVPRTSGLPFADAWASLRPRAADALPVIGRAGETEGLIFAAGHYRNGILLAPLTARLVCDLVVAGSHAEAPEMLRDFSPARFAHT